jgi:hypothetical protein
MNQQESSEKEALFRITDIEYSNSQIDDKIVGIFRFESTGPKKHGLSLLVFAEIEGIGYVYDQLIDVVNNETEHSRNLLSSMEQDPVSRFEKITQNINRAVKEFLEEETAPINWNRVNLFIVELSEGHLCLTGIGRLMNVFLQSQEDGSYKTYDLFGSLDQRADVDTAKLFSNIICGDFKTGDVLIAGSNNFERFRNELRIKERLTTLPPVTAALEIKQDLERRGIPDDFVATVIACTNADRPKHPSVSGASHIEQSTSSVQELRRTEAETARTLAPAIGPKEQKTEMREPKAPGIGMRASIFGKIFGLFRREKIRDVASMVNLRGMHAGFGSFFTRRRKSLIIGAVALIVIIAITGSFIKYRRAAAAEEAAWNSTYDGIRAQIDQAKGEEMYSEDKARKTLARALAELEALDAATSERQEAVAGLMGEADKLRTKLRRMMNVNDPKAIYALPDDLAAGALVSPILFQGKLIVADRANEELAVIDLNAGGISKIALPGGRAPVRGLAAGRSSVIVMLEDRSLLSADIESGEVAGLDLGGADASGVTDVLAYANRLYVLDASAEQIWRHPSVSGGFGAGQSYLQAGSADLKDAASLAIDSNVYVLKSNGTVVRYYSGGQDGFALTEIDPPLQNGNQIWTDAESEDIIIADKEGKRVVIFTKEGRLAAQYVSSAFQGPTDVTADPATNNMYVVDGNKVYELELP